MVHVSGRMNDGEKKFKGKFEVPNLSEENEPDEVDVTIILIVMPFCFVEYAKL